jgi:hypothetical protein
VIWRDFLVAVASCVAQKRGNSLFVSDKAAAETLWVVEFMGLFPCSFRRDEALMGWWFEPL